MPQPATLDDLAAELRRLRALGGSPSYADLARRIGTLRAERGQPHTAPGRITVYDAFRDGRARLDAALVLDLVAVLDPDADLALWRDRLASMTRASRVTISTVLPPAAPLRGRDLESATLARLAPGQCALITGLPGTGKSELAVAAAGRLGGRHLIVPMRGYHHSAPPLPAADVAAELLRLIDVPAREIAQLGPRQLPRRWRELAADLDLVVVLDDVSPRSEADELIAGGRCRTLVTSRESGAVTADVTVALAPLTEDETVALLADTIGAARVAAEPDAAADLARLAGGIPMQVLVVGGAVLQRPEWALTDHVHALATASRTSPLRPALQVSYARLMPSQQGLLRLLALHPDTPVDARRAGVLTDSDATADLAALEAANLLSARGDRYGWHDLVRDFAHDELQTQVPHSAQRAAVARLLRADLDLLAAAVEALHPGIAGQVTTQPGAAMLPAEATAFLAAELPTLLTLPEAARDWGLAAELSEASALLFPVLTFEVRLTEAVRVHSLAVQSGVPGREAQARRHLARAFEEQGRYTQAIAELEVALELDQPERDRLLMALGNVRLSQDDLPGAIDNYRAAIEACHDDLHRAFALANLSEGLRRSGDLPAARDAARRAIDLLAALGHRSHEAQVTANLALIAQAEGDLDEAYLLLEAAAERAGANRGHYLRVRASMASVLIDLGRLDEAEGAIDEVLAAVDERTLADLYHETLADRDRLAAAREGR